MMLNLYRKNAAFTLLTLPPTTALGRISCWADVSREAFTYSDYEVSDK